MGPLWSVLFTYPLMVGIQSVSARIGRVTGRGLAANLREHYPGWLLYGTVGLLLFANTINIAADIGAMAAALALLIGGSAKAYALGFALLSLALQIFVPFSWYAPLLKLLTLTLFAYVRDRVVVEVPWTEVAMATFLPTIAFERSQLVMLVAILGMTISPYLFFWQASQEVEQQKAAKGAEPLKDAPAQASRALSRIRLDTYVGMAFSNLVAFFIMLTAAVTLHTHGIHHIETSAQAAEALRPIAGDFAFGLFAAGIIGTGLLAVPVLAGSAAYAVGEAMRLPVGLRHTLPHARGFYAILCVATLLGVALNFTSVDPIKALVWSAVVNGIIAGPIMVVMMLMVTRADIMGRFVAGPRLKVLGWLATAVMAAAVLAMALAI